MNILTNTLLKDVTWASVEETALYALIGYAVVFAGIAFLIFIVWLVGKLMVKTGGVKIKEEKRAEEAPRTSILASVPQSDEMDEQTLAVITAALMAYYEKTNPKCEFTVKRIKKVRRNDYA